MAIAMVEESKLIQHSLIEVKSQSDMLLMRAESHENSKLEVERDVVAYLRNRMILNKHFVD